MSTIRIFLADDHAVLRAGLKALLNAEPDLAVVGEAENGEACVRQVARLQPDVVLLDVNMPRMNGLEALGELRKQAPACKILVLTMHDDPGYLRTVMAGGASGFVLKQAAGQELLAAIRAVYEGGIFLHPTHARLLMTPSAEAATSADRRDSSDLLSQLSEREIQVLKLVALGYRNQEIADKLVLSVKTVETYKSRLMQKLGITSRVGLVRYAMEHNLLDQPADNHSVS